MNIPVEASGHGTPNTGLQVFPSIDQTITDILLISTAYICVLPSLYLRKIYR
jgi:hypothetical protein